MSEATRTALHVAFTAVDAAKADVARARLVAEQAAALLENTKAAHTAAREAHEATKSAVVDTFRDTAAESAPDISEMRKASGRASVEAASAEADLAHDERLSEQMSSELAAAEARLRAAEKVRAAAANAIVIEQANAVVAEISELGTRRKHLREVLRGVYLESVTPHEAQQFASIVEAAMFDPIGAELVYPPTAPASTRYWRGLVQALIADADAPVSELPTSTELWT